MINYKEILFKLILLIILIVLFNKIYTTFFLEKDIQKHSDIINLVRNVVDDKNEIIYIGESSNFTFSDTDADKRYISNFVNDYFPTLKIGAINKEATHAGVFYDLLNNIPEKSTIKTVIITLNLRSFSAGWMYSNLETPLQKSQVLLKNNPPLYNRFILSFKGYDIKSESERNKQFLYKLKSEDLSNNYKSASNWDKEIFKNGIKNIDGSKNNEKTELACHYIKNFAFKIDTLNNERIKDFDKIVELANKRNWHLVFNLLAENIQMADSLVGKDLVDIMKQNRDILKNRYSKNKIIFIDNLEKVPNSEFLEQNWTSEHYTETGRKIIAKNIAKGLATIYPNKYKEINFLQQKKSEFYIDCEGKTPWLQMQTLTDELSFSGLKSSKTNSSQNFSLTFSYPIKKLQDSINKINANAMVFQNNINHQAKFIIEILTKDSNYLKYEFPLKNYSNDEKKWNKINFNLKLDSTFNTSELIKIYLYNPSETSIYMDDLNIQFIK